MEIQKGKSGQKLNTEKLKAQIELVFSIDREQNPGKFKNESLVLLEQLYVYVLEKYKNNRTLLFDANYEEYGLEIYELGLSCIKNFKNDNEKGASFLTYFVSAWEMECKRIKGKEAMVKGPSVPERDRKLYVKLKRYVEAKNIILSPALHAELVADVLEISVEKARSIIYLHFMEIKRLGPSEEDEDESKGEDPPDNRLTPEEYMLEKARWDASMKEIERAFKDGKLSAAVKDVLTCDIAGILMFFYEDYPYDYSFINTSLMKEILHSGVIPSREAIAKRNEMSSNALAMAYKRTMDKLRTKLNNRNGILSKTQEQK